MNGPRSALLRQRMQQCSRQRDEGFTLLESIMTISLITVIMTALASFFMTAIASTSEQRARQLAVQVADSAMERLRSINAVDVLTANGASQTSTFDAASLASSSPVSSWLGDMSAAAEIPATSTSVNKIQYSTTTYLGTCYVVTGDCAKSPATGVPYVRAVVAVTWPDQHCSNGSCAYVTATLLSTTADPQFNLNATPPPLPQLASELCGQTTVAGDAVTDVPLAVVSGTGVGTLTWRQRQVAADGTTPLPAQQMLPPGLTISAANTITGTIDRAATPGDYTATIEVTDGFARTVTAPCTWHVKPPLSIASVANPTDTVGTAVHPITLSAAGGSGPSYTFAATGLPSQVTLTNGTLAGTPTLPGSYPVAVTVTDSQNHQASTQFTWQVNPAPVTSTVGQPITGTQMQLGSGSGSYQWSDGKTLPTGLTISSGGLITGTPKSTGPYTVNLTATDSSTQATVTLTYRWTIVAAPTVTAPAAQTTTTGATVALPVTSTCLNTPCSYTLTTAPAGLTISSTGVISGQISSSAQVFPSATVTLTDAAGATAKATFSWTVNAKPTIASPGNQTTDATWSDSLSVAALVSGGTAPFTYSATNLPSWLTIDSSTGTISGTAPSTTGTKPYITVSVRDGFGFSATSTAFSWTVNPALTLADPGNQAGDAGQPDSLSVAAGGGTTPYTFSASGLPPWLAIDASTGVVSGTAPAKTGATNNITVTVTDATGATLTSAAFSWTVNPAPKLSVTAQTSTLYSSVSTSMKNFLTGGTGPYTFSASGLPPGLTINPTTGVVSGSPSAIGSYSTTVSVVDSSKMTASARFTWKVQ